MFRNRQAGLAAGIALLAAIAALPAFAQSAPLKVAVIDVQRIITESGTGKAALAQLEAWGKEQQNKLNARKDEIDQLQKRIAEGQLSLAEDRLADLKKDLETKSIEVRRAADDAQREFNQRQERALGEIERKVMPIIQKVGQEGGYTMILRKFDSGLVYASDEIDITAQIISRLDAGNS